MGLLKILDRYGLDTTKRIKLARHWDNKWDIEATVGTKDFEEYQSWQRYRVFHDLDYVVSFVGDGPRRARFWGVYRVLGQREVPFNRLPKTPPWPWYSTTPHYRYKLEKVAGFELLVAQLVIRWQGERQWHQLLRDHPVIEGPVTNDLNQSSPALRYIEGQPFSQFVTGRRRNRDAREACLKCHKAVCSVCEISFPDVYGGLANGFMHVHHRNAMAALADVRTVDPENDLTPVCPNCHAVLHLEGLTVEELRPIVLKSRSRRK